MVRTAAIVRAALLATAMTGAASARAQTASQITPPSFAPLPAMPQALIKVPQDNRNVAPAGSENVVVTLSDIVVDGPALAPDQLDDLRRDLVGHPVKVAAIFTAAQALERRLAANGRLLDRVVVPAQSLANGAALHLVIVEGYIERIDTSQVPRAVARKVDAILAPLVGRHGLTQGELERRLLLAADLPGTALRSTLAPGEATGGTVLTIDAPYRPVTGFVTIDNTLPNALGRDAFGLGLTFNSVLGFGETIYARASGLPNTGRRTSFLDPTPRNRALAAGFILPLGHDGLTFNLEGTDARTAPRHDVALPGFGSRFRRLSGRLRYPVIRSRALTASIEADFDAQDERVRIIDPIVLPLSLDSLRIARAAADVRAYLPGGGIASGRIAASFGIDGLGARTAADATVALPLSRAGTDASFRKLEVAASIDQPLGRHLGIALQGRAQTSFGEVMANSEEIGIASVDGLSPLPSGTLQGDAGYVGRGELRLPFAATWSGAVGQVAPYAFGAYGGVRFEQPTVFERRQTDAYAYGGGLRVAGSARSGSPGFSGTVEYGRAHVTSLPRETDRVTFTIITQF